MSSPVEASRRGSGRRRNPPNGARRDIGTLAGVPQPARPHARRELRPAPDAWGSTGRTPPPCWTNWPRRPPSCRPSSAAADPARLKDELGDMLFVLANLARKLDLDPEQCLAHANAKFTRRFEAVEALLAAEGQMPADAGLDAMEAAWRRVKANEAERAGYAGNVTTACTPPSGGSSTRHRRHGPATCCARSAGRGRRRRSPDCGFVPADETARTRGPFPRPECLARRPPSYRYSAIRRRHQATRADPP